QPVSVLFTIAAPIALVTLALTKLQDDPQARQAAFIGAAIAAVGGVFFSAGLAQNIDVAVQSGSAAVALDPVRWGTLPFETNRAFSTFGNPDLLGGYLIFPWAVAIGLALSEEHRLWRAIYWVFTLFNAFVGVTSYVRGAWIGATVSLILLTVSYLRSRSGTETRLSAIDKAFIGAGAATIGVAAVASSLRPDAVRNVLTQARRCEERAHACGLHLPVRPGKRAHTVPDMGGGSCGHRREAAARVGGRYVQVALPDVQACRVRKGGRLPVGGR
ncbi:MAG: O-antigen polymerase, partial [Actinobacteria bacterium 66_15]